MRGVVKKWGNSAAVRIPAAILAAAKLDVDQAVEVREEGGRVIIEPVRPPQFSLAEMLAMITAENLHEEIDTRSSQGREYW